MSASARSAPATAETPCARKSNKKRKRSVHFHNFIEVLEYVEPDEETAEKLAAFADVQALAAANSGQLAVERATEAAVSKSKPDEEDEEGTAEEEAALAACLLASGSLHDPFLTSLLYSPASSST